MTHNPIKWMRENKRAWDEYEAREREEVIKRDEWVEQARKWRAETRKAIYDEEGRLRPQFRKSAPPPTYEESEERAHGISVHGRQVPAEPVAESDEEFVKKMTKDDEDTKCPSESSIFSIFHAIGWLTLTQQGQNPDGAAQVCEDIETKPPLRWFEKED